MTLKSGGGVPPAPDDAPFVTIAHIMKQLATAFATPFEDDASSPTSGAAAESAEDAAAERLNITRK